MWPAHFSEPLPTIPIPLAGTDPDLSLDLQPLVEAIYARSRYERDLDYRRPLAPPLSPAEQAWLDKRLTPKVANAKHLLVPKREFGNEGLSFRIVKEPILASMKP